MSLLDPAFWRSIGLALVRTAIAGLVPFLPGLTSDPADTWPLAAGTVGLLLIVTVATSLRGLADASTATWWEILAARGLRQFGQFLTAGLASAVVLSDVDWATLLQQAGASAASTVLLAALTVRCTGTPRADHCTPCGRRLAIGCLARPARAARAVHGPRLNRLRTPPGRATELAVRRRKAGVPHPVATH